jgi:hypothetical protein
LFSRGSFVVSSQTKPLPAEFEDADALRRFENRTSGQQRIAGPTVGVNWGGQPGEQRTLGGKKERAVLVE